MGTVKKKGFSLIEILVVLGIIGIISSFITPKIMFYMARGKETKVISTLESLRTASEIYFMETGNSLMSSEKYGNITRKEIKILEDYLSDNVSFLIKDILSDTTPVKMEIGGSKTSKTGDITYGGEIRFTTKAPEGKTADGIKIWIDGEDVGAYSMNGDKWTDL